MSHNTFPLALHADSSCIIVIVISGVNSGVAIEYVLVAIYMSRHCADSKGKERSDRTGEGVHWPAKDTFYACSTDDTVQYLDT